MKDVNDLIKNMKRIEAELTELKRHVKTYVELNSYTGIDQRIWDARTGVYKAQRALKGSLENFKKGGRHA